MKEVTDESMRFLETMICEQSFWRLNVMIICALNKSQPRVKYRMEGCPNVWIFVDELVDMLYWSPGWNADAK